MARKLIVEVVGDASSLERTFKKSAASAKGFENSLGKLGRGSIAASGAFQGLGRSIAFASAGFLGGFGFVAAVKAAFDEMSKAQQVAAQTNAAIKSTGGIAGVSAEHVDELGTALLNLSGVDDEVIKGAENVLLTFTKVRDVAGEGNDIFDQATKSALDLSVRFNKDLASSAILVGKALQDPIRGLTALQRTGVQFTDRQKAMIKSLVESGHVMEAQKIILKELRTEFGGSARAAGDTLAGKLNIAKQIILNMGGAIAQSLLPSLTKAADQLDTWLKNPENQKKVVDNLTTAIRQLGAAFEFLAKTTKGIISAFKAVSFATGLFLIEMERAVKRTFLKIIEPFTHLPSSAGAWARRLKDQVRAEIDAIDESVNELNQARDAAIPAGALGPVDAKGRHPGGARFRGTAAPPASGTIPEVDKGIASRLRAAREAARQAVQDQAELAVSRAQLTKGFSDDLAALQKLNTLLLRRIKGGHDTIQLQQQQIQVEQQIADLIQQQAEARQKARDARQFRLLGFGPEGEDLVPGVKALKRTLGNVADAIAGSFLDTRKTRGLLGHIRQVLAGGLGSVSSEVRSKIQQILADLRAQLKQSSVDVTRFQKTASGQFTLAGAHPAGRGVIINGGVHLHGIQNVQQLENELAKRSKQRAHARRSTR